MAGPLLPLGVALGAGTIFDQSEQLGQKPIPPGLSPFSQQMQRALRVPGEAFGQVKNDVWNWLPKGMQDYFTVPEGKAGPMAPLGPKMEPEIIPLGEAGHPLTDKRTRALEVVQEYQRQLEALGIGQSGEAEVFDLPGMAIPPPPPELPAPVDRSKIYAKLLDDIKTNRPVADSPEERKNAQLMSVIQGLAGGLSGAGGARSISEIVLKAGAGALGGMAAGAQRQQSRDDQQKQEGRRQADTEAKADFAFGGSELDHEEALRRQVWQNAQNIYSYERETQKMRAPKIELHNGVLYTTETLPNGKRQMKVMDVGKVEQRESQKQLMRILAGDLAADAAMPPRNMQELIVGSFTQQGMTLGENGKPTFNPIAAQHNFFPVFGAETVRRAEAAAEKEALRQNTAMGGQMPKPRLENIKNTTFIGLLMETLQEARDSNDPQKRKLWDNFMREWIGHGRVPGVRIKAEGTTPTGGE